MIILPKNHLMPKELPKLSQDVSVIDTHCHLDMPAYQKDFDSILKRCRSHRVNHIITIGIDIPSSQRAVNLAKSHPNISATIGIHPHDVDPVTASHYDAMGEIYNREHRHIVAYGEVGLDYVKKYSAIDNQKKHFANQLDLAKQLRLPVVIHDREAHQDTLDILNRSGISQYGGVMHCFSGDLELAKKIIDLGLYVSIPGVVTFKNALALQEVAAKIPLEAMLLETDGPFLSPHPKRGKRNEPAYVLYTARHIAQLRGISLDELAIQTTKNAQKLFGITTDC